MHSELSCKRILLTHRKSLEITFSRNNFCEKKRNFRDITHYFREKKTKQIIVFDEVFILKIV